MDTSPITTSHVRSAFVFSNDFIYLFIILLLFFFFFFLFVVFFLEDFPNSILKKQPLIGYSIW